jgi:hypothetical protein
MQLLCLWTLSIVVFLLKTHNVSETGFYLRLQVKHTQFGSPEDRDRNLSPKRCVKNF